MKKIFSIILFVLTLGLFFSGNNFISAQIEPQIYSISPADGQHPGGLITVSGFAFSISPAENRIFFEQPAGNTKGSVLVKSSDGKTLSVVLPANLTAPGTVIIKITTADNRATSPFSYSVKEISKFNVSGTSPSSIPINIPSFNISGTGFPAGNYKLLFPQKGGNFWPNSVTRLTPDTVRVTANPWPSFVDIGKHTVILLAETSVARMESNPFGLNITLPKPVISFIDPSAQETGGEISIKGVNFLEGVDNNVVEFLKLDGTVFQGMSPKSASTQEIKVNVPSSETVPLDVLGRAEGAKVRVRVKGWEPSDSVLFSIIAPPKIESVAPNKALAGTTIVVSGQNFKSSPNENRVYFENREIFPDKSSLDRLEFKVPDLIPKTYQIQIGAWWFGRFIKSNTLPFEILPPPEKSIKEVTIEGETFIAGKNYTIKWWSKGIDDFCIRLWKGEKEDYQLSCNIKGTSYSWQIKPDQKLGNDYKIQVCEDKFLPPGCGKEAFSGIFGITSEYEIILNDVKGICPSPPLVNLGCTEENLRKAIIPGLEAGRNIVLNEQQRNEIINIIRAAGGISPLTEAPPQLTDIDIQLVTDCVNKYISRNTFTKETLKGTIILDCEDQIAKQLGRQVLLTSDEVEKIINDIQVAGGINPSVQQPSQQDQSGVSGASGAPAAPGEKCDPNSNKLCNPLTAENFGDLINIIINFLFWIAIVAGPLMILVAAFMYLTSGGDARKITTAKNIILYTAVGIGVALLAKGLISIIKSVFSG